MLVLRQPCQRHEKDPFLGPAGFGGDSEDLGGYEAGFVASRGFFPASPDTGSTCAASSSRLCASSRWKAVWKSSGVSPPQKIRAASRTPWSLNDARTTSGQGAQWVGRRGPGMLGVAPAAAHAAARQADEEGAAAGVDAFPLEGVEGFHHRQGLVGRCWCRIRCRWLGRRTS